MPRHPPRRCAQRVPQKMPVPFFAVPFFALAMISCAAALGAPEKPCPIVLRDVTRRTGIDFKHTDGCTDNITLWKR